VLTLTDIERSYQGRPVLCGVSLTLHAGEVAWLGGANGAGKTTLLRVAVGLVAPDRGTVALEGLDPVRDRRAYQRRMGFLSAGDRGMYARLTVAQHLRLWSDLALVPAVHRPVLVSQITAAMGLEELLDRRVDRMSMGQRQRVRLAMTFLHEPDVVLLDEPHTSLDEEGLALLAQALEMHAADGGAALWCSPSLALGELRNDSAQRLVNGRLEAV
jgi:ABC-type multidrug transport system ATPase subunit